MGIVYVEARPKGWPGGSPIDDFVVEDHGGRVLHTARKQAEAIAWAKKNGHTPHVPPRGISTTRKGQRTGGQARPRTMVGARMAVLLLAANQHRVGKLADTPSQAEAAKLLNIGAAWVRRRNSS